MKHWLAALLCMGLILSGCASGPKQGAGVRTPFIKGSPATTGLVIIKAEFLNHVPDSEKQMIMKHVLLVGLEQRGKIEPVYALAIAGKDMKYFHDSFMVMPDIEPGDYEIVSIEIAHNPLLSQRFTMDQFVARKEALSFKVVAGEAKFVGLLQFSDRTITGEAKLNAERFPDKKAELQAWQRFLDLYPGHAEWTSIIQKRVDVLTQELASEAVPVPQ